MNTVGFIYSEFKKRKKKNMPEVFSHPRTHTHTHTHTGRVKGQAGSLRLSKLGGTTARSGGGQVLNVREDFEAHKAFMAPRAASRK